jgi:hypothetical protein
MIERLASSLRELAMLTDAELSSAASARTRADCADALRLELDCPQQALTPLQRSALRRLSDALEETTPLPTLPRAIHEAVDAIRAGESGRT